MLCIGVRALTTRRRVRDLRLAVAAGRLLACMADETVEVAGADGSPDAARMYSFSRTSRAISQAAAGPSE